MRRELTECPWCLSKIKKVESGIKYKSVRTAIRTEFLCGVVQIAFWTSKRGTVVEIAKSCLEIKKINSLLEEEKRSSASLDQTSDLSLPQTSHDSLMSSNPDLDQEF